MNQLNLIPEERDRIHLAPEAVHLPDLFDLDDQRELLRICREAAAQLGLQHLPTGCRNTDGSAQTMQVRVMSFGWQWSLLYGYRPPLLPIPDILARIANKAVLIGLTRYCPYLTDGNRGKFAAICQFYAPGDALGMHRDKSEDLELIEAGSPIVSLSLGDSCAFRFRSVTGDRTIELRSGDVVVWGGAERMTEHGVPRIYPGTAPPALGMKPGRLNITIRQAKV